MTTETIPQRVARGAAWLDRTRPGWRDYITPSLLVMHEGSHCVCGQVFAEDGSTWGDGYCYVQDHYADDRHWEIRHGFTLDLNIRERWGDLEAEWLRVIGIGAPKRERVHARV